jgi:hypothetical protein
LRHVSGFFRSDHGSCESVQAGEVRFYEPFEGAHIAMRRLFNEVLHPPDPSVRAAGIR